MKMTVPQIILWNHAASVNHKRQDARWEAERKVKEKQEGKGRPQSMQYEVVSPAGEVPDFSNMRAEAIVSYIASGQEF